MRGFSFRLDLHKRSHGLMLCVQKLLQLSLTFWTIYHRLSSVINFDMLLDLLVDLTQQLSHVNGALPFGFSLPTPLRSLLRRLI